MKTYKNICSMLFIVFLISMPVHGDIINESEELYEIAEVFNSAKDTEGMPEINAAYAVVIDAESGRVLYEKNAYKKVPMASTTKIMTAIIALEEGVLSDNVTVSQRAASIGGSTINLVKGKQYSLQYLLYGLLMNSGNDAAIALAEHIGGTVDGFLEKMNKKAHIIGARNTNFCSPHGLDMDRHYSTAWDLAIIAGYALQNDIFARIVSTKQITVNGRSFYNTNEMLSLYPGADGVKTGYTGKAGRCLVTSASRNDVKLISVILGSSSRSQRALSSKKILDYAFDNYSRYFLCKKGDLIASIPIKKGKLDKVELRAAQDFEYLLSQKEIRLIEKRVSITGSLEAPVYAGVDAGVLNIILDGEYIASIPLKVWQTVEKKIFRDYFEDIFKAWICIVKEGMFQ